MDINNDSDNTSVSDFSIDYILNRAGNNDRNCENNSGIEDCRLRFDFQFPWLQCTRYSPPKIQRNGRKDGPTTKRQLGRHPRIPFTTHQLSILEEKFKERPYISSDEVTSLSTSLNLTDIRVKIWFQNRRARERRERLPLESSSRSKSLPHLNKFEYSDLQTPNTSHSSESSLFINQLNEVYFYQDK